MRSYLNIELLYRRLIIIAALFVALSCTRAGERGINPGDYPPELDLPALGGGRVTLDSFKGKVVLLNFWASWCGPCIEEMPGLQRLYQRLKDRGFVVVAVGVDDSEKNLTEFQQRFGLSFPILVDEPGASKSRYRLNGVPESFVIAVDGKLVMIPDPQSSEPTVRVMGPREWDSPNSIAKFSALLNQNNK